MSKSRRPQRGHRPPQTRSDKPGAHHLEAMDAHFAAQPGPDHSTTDGILDTLLADAAAKQPKGLDPDQPGPTPGPSVTSHREPGGRGYDVEVTRHKKGFVFPTQDPELEPLPRQRRRNRPKGFDFSGEEGAFEDGELTVGEEAPAPTTDPKTAAEIERTIARIDELREKARVAREMGDDAINETCGVADQINEKDTTGQKVMKVLKNAFTQVDPYECMGGHEWGKKMHREADELDRQADAEERKLDALLEAVPE